MEGRLGEVVNAIIKNQIAMLDSHKKIIELALIQSDDQIRFSPLPVNFMKRMFSSLISSKAVSEEGLPCFEMFPTGSTYLLFPVPNRS